MQNNIPQTNKKRVVIVGGGFGGLTLARKLRKSDYQVVLVDKNNYHQFQPLFYQVAMSGLEPASISFPLRKMFHSADNVHIRLTDATRVEPQRNVLHTGIGEIPFDYLVIAAGADTNYFGMANVQQHAIPMKSVSESLYLRNRLLQNYEDALTITDATELERYMNIVIVGGGATGVEVAGSLAEMKRFVFPKDYKELDCSKIKIYLVEAGSKILAAMSEVSSEKSLQYLRDMGVEVLLNTQVKDYDGKQVTFADGKTIPTRNLIWAAGIRGNRLEGLSPDVIGGGGRIKTDRMNRVQGYENIFAIGDVALMTEPKYERGHPQVATVAMQQGALLATNLKLAAKGQPMKEFSYFNKGSMATVGRNRAVVDLPFLRFQGLFAWLTWMFVHLMSLVGGRNRVVVFINWMWSYLTYDQSLRLIIRPRTDRQP